MASEIVMALIVIIRRNLAFSVICIVLNFIIEKLNRVIIAIGTAFINVYCFRAVF